MYKDLSEKLEKEIEDFLDGFPEKDLSGKKNVNIALRLLVKKYKMKNVRMRPQEKNWVEAAKFLYESKLSKAHIKAGYSNFKNWVTEKYNMHWRQAFEYIQGYKEFNNTPVLSLPWSRVKRILALPKPLIVKLKKEGGLCGKTV